MGKVEVRGLRFHAYHGCLPAEAKTGGTFEVDITVEHDFAQAATTDRLHDAVDYTRLMEIAAQHMAVRCDLVETVAVNTAKAIKAAFPQAGSVTVTVRKIHPPVEYELAHISVSHTV